ncbi:hypothetical protein D770_07155 [Flammeovirgaceae bacterium 311]|nr:hypothetical protein D770_07155 [Flammeovirgaceae bacterium 311]
MSIITFRKRIVSAQQQIFTYSGSLFVKILLLMLVCFSSIAVQATELQFEENWLILESGQAEKSALHYNVETDVLTVRSMEGLMEFTPKEVISFSYRGHEYFSLPFNEGYSFFKVLHEGSDFAVLQKPANQSLLRYFVEESRGSLKICEDSTDPANMVLCEGSIGPSFGMPVYSGSSAEYILQDAVFVAVGGRLNLVSYKYDTKGRLTNSITMPQLNKQNRRLLNRLKEVVGNEQKMMQLRRYSAATRADLEDPNELITALKTIYN